ncbi:MAG: type II toxin-antitoxin system RelE/ParE family toxin [Minicystis sp.]
MRYQLILLERARRELAALSAKARERITTKILLLGDDPRPPGNKKLKGRDDQYRIRVGDYRVIYSIEDAALLVTVLVIGQRGGVYD